MLQFIWLANNNGYFNTYVVILQEIVIPDSYEFYCTVFLQVLKKNQKSCNPREIAQTIISALPENDIIEKVCLSLLDLKLNPCATCGTNSF